LELRNRIAGKAPKLPKDHIDVIRRLLPERYSPLQPNGNGLQSVYLTEIPASLAAVLMGRIKSRGATSSPRAEIQVRYHLSDAQIEMLIAPLLSAAKPAGVRHVSRLA
jgi:hypothetical protein